MKKKLLICINIIFIILIIGLYFIGDYFVEYALGRKPIDDNDPLAPSHIVSELEYNNTIRAKELSNQWLDIVSEEIVSIESFDNLNLNSMLVKQPKYTNNWAIIVHGYTSNHQAMHDVSYQFYLNGYNILSPDLRAHGTSEGQYMTMGYYDAIDIVDWCDMIIKEDSNAKIVLYGISMGGATVMTAAGDKHLPDNVFAIIEDCGYTNAYDMMVSQLKFRFNLGEFPIIPVANIIGEQKARFNLKDASPISALENSDLPILFIHGDIDTYVPYEMLDILYESYDYDKEKYIVKGAEHGVARHIEPEKYYNTIFNFIDKYY